MDEDARRAYGLIAAGLGLIGLTRTFKRRGMLRPYQIGYAATWITLGSGVMRWTQVWFGLSSSVCHRHRHVSSHPRSFIAHWPARERSEDARGSGGSGKSRPRGGGQRTVECLCSRTRSSRGGRDRAVAGVRRSGGGLVVGLCWTVARPWSSRMQWCVLPSLAKGEPCFRRRRVIHKTIDTLPRRQRSALLEAAANAPMRGSASAVGHSRLPSVLVRFSRNRTVYS